MRSYQGKNLLRDHRLAADGGLAGLPEDLESDIKLARGVHSRALGNPAGDHDLLEEVVDTADEFGLIIELVVSTKVDDHAAVDLTLTGRGDGDGRVKCCPKGIADVGGGEVDAPGIGLEPDTDGYFPVRNIGNIRSGDTGPASSVAVDVFTTAGNESLIERRAGPGRAEKEGQTHRFALEGVVADKCLDTVDVGGPGVGHGDTGQTESGAGADDVLKVGDEPGDLGIEVAAAMAQAEFVADSLFWLNVGV